MTHFCDKFSDNVQILELCINAVDCLRYIHQVLTNCCPNLTRLRIACSFTKTKQMLMDPLPPKAKLTSFLFYSSRKPPVSFIQAVVNASPNLRELSIPWGIHPNFENSKSIDSLTIGARALQARRIDRFKPVEMSRMLNQIGDQLVTLGFGEYDEVVCITGSGNWDRQEFRLPRKMPKLQKYRNMLLDVFQCDDVLHDFEKMPVLKRLVLGKTYRTKSASLHEYLQTIFNAGKILGGVESLKIFEMHDPTLLEGLKTAFPNLVRLELDTGDMTDHRGEESRMKWGPVLKACAGWVGLKHLYLSLPTESDLVLDVIQGLLDGSELYKTLKTFEMGQCCGDDVTHDFTEIELNLFKQVLVATDEMDEVEIHVQLQIC
ncbi:uncharacterized protein LOC118435785 [Folsomia candida]|uniref:uncharacterized protein LOC118435785 n=1 Tax=Folsomia candida TaxID=158441 RepID=UPI001604C621|nr:uncharacterized protein LOC118435785 [Folsomia candida]XP_035708096.1 uncharacterized protein LOC118435785 [Folsomia candida]